MKANDRIKRVEKGFRPMILGENEAVFRPTLERIMKLLNIPGLSVAVIDRFNIVWAKGYGTTEAGTTNPVTPNTIFQAGSVSKPVAAAGALCLVEQEKLSALVY